MNKIIVKYKFCHPKINLEHQEVEFELKEASENNIELIQEQDLKKELERHANKAVKYFYDYLKKGFEEAHKNFAKSFDAD